MLELFCSCIQTKCHICFIILDVLKSVLVSTLLITWVIEDVQVILDNFQIKNMFKTKNFNIKIRTLQSGFPQILWNNGISKESGYKNHWFTGYLANWTIILEITFHQLNVMKWNEIYSPFFTKRDSNTKLN